MEILRAGSIQCDTDMKDLRHHLLWTKGMPCTQCEVLDVGKYSNPSFGPFSQASVEAVQFALQSTLADT